MDKLQKVLAELTALLKRYEALKAQAKKLDEQIEQKKLELQKALSKTE
ncbi:MAG: hypothetical protein ABFD52_00655 [Acidobacteriota bacterium]